MKAKIEIREGYSGVDHFASEVAWFATRDAKDCRTPQGARRSAWAAIRRTLRDKSPNGDRSYGSYGLTTLSFVVR